MSEALARSNPAANLSNLPEHARQAMNLLVPTEHTMQIGPCLQARLSMVKLDANPSAGDVYHSSVFMGKGEVALTKVGLLKLARAAGIKWITQECRPISNLRDLDYIAYEVVGAVRLPSGEWQKIKATKEIDFRPDGTEAAKLWKIADKKTNQNGSPWSQEQRETYVARELARMKENRLTMCETKAYLRAVRALLSLKAKYTEAELQKPFVIPHIDFAPDYSDPVVRDHYLRVMAAESAALFGGTVDQPALPAPSSTHGPSTEPDDTITGEVYEVPDDEEEEPPSDLWGGAREEPPAAPTSDPIEEWTQARLKEIIDAQSAADLTAASKTIQAKKGELAAANLQLSQDQVDRLSNAYTASMTRIKGGK